MLLLPLLLSGCVIDEDGEDLSSTEQAIGTTADPCLTEAPDRTRYTFGSLTPTDQTYLTAGDCSSFVAEWTPLVGSDVYTRVQWRQSATLTKADCDLFQSTQRVYKKASGGSSWLYVGETHRYGYWDVDHCTQRLSTEQTESGVLALNATAVRVIASVNRGTARVTPTVAFDDEPFLEPFPPGVYPPPANPYVDLGPDDPCVNEAVDGTFAPQPPYVGVLPRPPGFSWLVSSVCQWHISEWTSRATPDLFVKVRFGGTLSEQQCTQLQVRERVYSKNGFATTWRYVGEAVRMGVWSAGGCLERLDERSTQIRIPGGVGPRRIRVLSSVHSGFTIGNPIAYLDDAPLAED